MRTNPSVAKHAISKRMQIKDEKEIEDTYLLLKSFVPIKPYPTLDGFKTIFDDLSRKVPAAKTANPKEFVDTRFIDELDQSGYIDSLYK